VGHLMVHHYKRSQTGRGGIGDPGGLGGIGGGSGSSGGRWPGSGGGLQIGGMPPKVPVGDPMHRPILEHYRGFDPRAVCSAQLT